MPPVNAVVEWDAEKKKGTVAKIVVPAGSGATVIMWTCGANVASFKIKGLNASEFSPSESGDNVTTFTTTDANNEAKTYHYTVHATHTNGQTSTHDPKIENGG
jgi:formylmethanofuran dehydrogenase subunit A